MVFEKETAARTQAAKYRFNKASVKKITPSMADKKFSRYSMMTKADRNAVLCWCCHCVRGCERCCKTCKSECNLCHDCEHDIWDATRQSTADALEWYHGVSTTMCSDFALSKIPDGIKSRVEKLTSKPIQLELFDL